MTYLPAALAVSILLLLTACNSGGSTEGRPFDLQQAQLQPPPAMLASFPDLPVDQRVHPMRATAAYNAVVLGSDFDSANEDVSQQGNAGVFSSSSGKLAWAIYRFSGSPDEVIDELSYTSSGVEPSELLYLAIADYQSGRWDFLSSQSANAASFPLDSTLGRWQSPLGNSYVAVMAYGGDNFDLLNVQLNYANRFSISGHIRDGAGQPIADVLVASVFGGASSTTDAAGFYSIGGLPNGEWPLATTLNGWTFYDQPDSALIDNADAVVDFWGDEHGSNFFNEDAAEDNDTSPGAFWDHTQGPVTDSLARHDDRFDYYNFVISEAGDYYLYFHDAAQTLLYPHLTLYFHGNGFYNRGQHGFIAENANVLSGSFAVAFHVSEAPVHLELQLTCTGGGSDYTLSLKQGLTHALGGSINEGATELRMLKIALEHGQSGHSTEYFSTRSYGSLGYIDRFRLPGQTTIEPQGEGFSFTPPSRSLNLGAEALGQDFEADPPELADAHEPNDSHAQSAAVSLPVSEELSIGADDSEDWFSYSAEPGKLLRPKIYLLSEAVNERQTDTLSVEIFDAEEERIDKLLSGSKGCYAVPQTLGNGATHYLKVHCESSVRLPYRLEIDSVDPTSLNVAARVGDDPVCRALAHVYNEDFSELYLVSTGETGQSEALYFEPGSVVNVRFERFGLALDGHTRRFTLGEDAQVISFDNPDWGLDADNEPDQERDMPDPRPLPLDTSALISTRSDNQDSYRLLAPELTSYLVEFVPDPPTAGVSCRAYASNPIAMKEFRGAGEMRFRITSPGLQWVDVVLTGSTSEFSYSLTVTEAESYKVSGNFLDELFNPVDGAAVLIRENGLVVRSSLVGSYETELLPPGAYELELFAPGYAQHGEVYPVNLVDADVVQEFFDLSPVDADNYEPNDSIGVATAINPDTQYEAMCGSLSQADPADFYKLSSLTAGSRLRIRLLGDVAATLTAEVFRGGLNYPEGPLAQLGPGVLMKDMLLTADADYFIRISGSGIYTLKAETVP